MKRPIIVFIAFFLVALFQVQGATGASQQQTDPAELSYRKARACYYDVKKDAERHRSRAAWEGCIRLFLEVERDFSGTDRAVEASYSAGRAYEDIAGVSKNPHDLELATKQFAHVAKKYRKHRLADDALYQIGRIELEGLKNTRKARSVMWKIVRWYPEGDMANDARRTLRTLADAKHSRRPAGGLLNIEPQAVTVAGPVASRLPVTSITKTPEPATAQPSAEAVADVVQKESLIVIDPGHGGKDSGAIGPKGTMEKNVTLAIARRLAAALKSMGGYRVLLTRDKDVYVKLEDRNAYANLHSADVFVSVHANAAAGRGPKGIQTYYLNNATDEAGRRLADRENRVSGKSADEIAHIVSTMLQNAMTDESRELARTVQSGIVGAACWDYNGIVDDGVNTALFYVLVGAKSPGVLVETSYISNPQEEKRLADAKYQTTLAKAIAAGVDTYLHKRRPLNNL